MSKGMVKLYNTATGKGLLVDEGNKEYEFDVHAVSFGTMPRLGMMVNFEWEKADTPEGYRVTQVAALESAPASSSADESRIVCPRCGRKIVPRLVYQKGFIRGSVCPFCGQEIKSAFELGGGLSMGALKFWRVIVTLLAIYFSLEAFLECLSVVMRDGTSNIEIASKRVCVAIVIWAWWYVLQDKIERKRALGF